VVSSSGGGAVAWGAGWGVDGGGDGFASGFGGTAEGIVFAGSDFAAADPVEPVDPAVELAGAPAAL